MRRFLFAFLLILSTFIANAAMCPVNQFLLNGQCVNCIYNATCDGEQYKCNDGFYDTGASECVACPPNSTCTSPTEFSCIEGTYLSGGKCAACPPNAICAGGTEPVHCKDGYYKDKKNNCVSCAGHTCEGEQVVCCGPGYYLHGGGQCLICASNYYCPRDECVVGITCDVGAYKNENGTCTWCDAPYYCPRGKMNRYNKSDYCNIGYYRSGNECKKCPDGITCVGTYPDNMVCPDGLHLHSDGQCLSYAENDPGVPGACNPGYYDSGTECVACPAGSQCVSATDFTCMDGYWKNGNKCDLCPDNSTCPTGSTQISCNPGYWLNDNKCTECGFGGFYCTDNIRHGCPVYSADTVPLPDNHTVDSWTISTYGTTQASSPASCSINISVTTPMGKYEQGYTRYDINTSQYVKSSTVWKSANVGYYLDKPSLQYYGIDYLAVTQCTNAPEHATYTSAGSPEGNDCSWRCDDGFFHDGDICTVCPSHLECMNGKIVCPAGQYAAGNSCLNCPENYTARAPDNTAPQSINECQIKCDGGTYLATANSTECVNVGAGFWNAVNYTNYGSVGVRNQCPVGLTTIGFGAGADDASDCGKILHIGDYKLYLRSVKLTSPSLVIQYGGRVLYADMKREKHGKLRTEYNGSAYWIYNTDID